MSRARRDPVPPRRGFGTAPRGTGPARRAGRAAAVLAALALAAAGCTPRVIPAGPPVTTAALLPELPGAGAPARSAAIPAAPAAIPPVSGAPAPVPLIAGTPAPAAPAPAAPAPGAAAPDAADPGDPAPVAAIPGALVMPDGARLPLWRWLPEGPPRLVVLGVHGFGDTAHNSFDMPAPWFVRAGIALYAYDQRGFGQGPHPGIWAGPDTLAGDLRQAVRLIRARHPGLRLVLMGESMGAALLLDVAASADPPAAEGYVLLAPALRGRASLSPFLRGTLEVLAHTIPLVGFRNSAPGFLPTDNPEAMRRYAADPHTLREIRVDLLWGLMDQMDRGVAAAARFRAPALILYGEQDRLITGEAIRDALRTLPSGWAPGAPQRIALYPEGHHLLLRDLGRAVVARDILAWLDDPRAPLPSGADSAGRRWLAGADAPPAMSERTASASSRP